MATLADYRGVFGKAAILSLFAVLTCGCLNATSFGMNGSGLWACGFYPGDTGYGTDEILTFASKDASGNPINGMIDFGDEHASPPCTPGLQAFQGTVDEFGGAIAGEYSYLGQTYTTIAAGEPNSACIQPGCSISVTADRNGGISLVLGYKQNGYNYIDLSGFADITSSSFRQTVNDGYKYYYSIGRFTLLSTPEPGAAFLGIIGLATLWGVHRRRSAGEP